MAPFNIPRSSLLALVLAFGVAIPGCTSDDSTPRTTPSTAPTSSTSSASSRENRIEADFEAAEKAYRTNLKEQNRLYALGGSQKATKVLMATASGRYLALVTKSLQTLDDNNWRVVGTTVVAGISRSGWAESRIGLIACEDSSQTRIVDSRKKDVTPKGPRRFVQTLSIEKLNGVWKVATVDTVRVATFENQAACL
jgi:hypothetical protein